MAQNDGGQRPAPSGAPRPVVAFEQVSYSVRRGFWRRHSTVFDGLSFSVAAGEAVGLLFPPGAGKTSLVKLATGHCSPSFGSISVLGHKPYTGHAELAGRVGAIVNEHSQLWFDVPLGESFTMVCRLLELPDGSADELVERLELGRALRTPVGNLTPAQRRRAELVAALLPDPEVLILDEPTRGMDAGSKERLRSVLRQENRMNGRALLLATSDLADVESLCPRLLVGVDGRIGFDGDVPALTELLGTERVLVVDLLAPTAPLDDLAGTELIAVEAGGLRQRLGITPGRGSTAKVLAEVVARAPVRNLSLEEPDVSELVRRLTP
ncbi:ATP-binding cassette domain-containing protein [Kineosporia sp. J2-2]|uniref:ATP-binding cassette domain-containing protein n=1 Tax=Kineosporia corallincola TaxID=2835133 RepID=A0ABS5TA33_9ACTN|nr:ATP-binding cassette domain-containing protein [Kineosporia corallincola]MBT0767723.1 ATP-binding cassette domain-containing protein [Kineosporia corallincola]